MIGDWMDSEGGDDVAVAKERESTKQIQRERLREREIERD